MMVWTGFVVGLLGSFHCVGMCGPIALSLPYQSTTKWQTAANTLVYNLGRVSTYALLGVIFGLLGEGFVLAGVQQSLSIVLGFLLLLAAFSIVNFEKKILTLPFLQPFLFKVKIKLGELLKSKQQQTPTLFLVGVLNGFLPCGLVYMAVAGAVAMANFGQSIAYMTLFGLGTIPLMLGTALLGNFVTLTFRRRIQQLVPVFLFAFALLFIIRGLNLGIPYLSPLLIEETSSSVVTPPICH